MCNEVVKGRVRMRIMVKDCHIISSCSFDIWMLFCDAEKFHLCLGYTFLDFYFIFYYPLLLINKKRIVVRNIRKYQASYLNKIMLYASGYAGVFMFSMSLATVLALPIMPPALFVIGYLAGFYTLQYSTWKESQAPSSTAIALMVGLTAWVGVYLGSIMALSPVMLGYFCFSIYSSILVTSGLVYFRDTLIPKNLTDLISQSFTIVATSAVVWFLASVVMQASMPVMTIGFAALSSYLSVMFIMTNIRMALLEAKVSDKPAHAASVAFCVFMNTLSLALDIFNVIMAVKVSSEDKKRMDKKRGVASRPASSWQAFWRMLAIVVDLFRVFAINKRLDQMEELIVIDKGDGYKTTKPNNTKPVRATAVNGSAVPEDDVVYDRHGRPVAIGHWYEDEDPTEDDALLFDSGAV